jgi:HSP20 family molecular chaperone IbpA
MTERKANRDEMAEQIRQLKEEVRKLRKASSEPPAKKEGVAEGIMADLGNMIPGLRKLINTASEMPEFHQRLASIDEEIKRRFKEQPLRRASVEITRGIAHRALGIPPGVRRGRAGRPISPGTGGVRRSGKGAVHRERRKPRSPKVRISPETPDQLPVDVFDEGDRLVVLAEAPGLMLKQITVCLEGTVLVISIDSSKGKSAQRIELPCAVAGQPKISLAKGILKVQVSKADKQ